MTDAPWVRTQVAGIARGPPITVGGRFAVFVGSFDCEEFDLTIADGPEEPDPVVFTAHDTVTDVASTIVVDALDRDLEREDAVRRCCRCHSATQTRNVHQNQVRVQLTHVAGQDRLR